MDPFLMVLAKKLATCDRLSVPRRSLQSTMGFLVVVCCCCCGPITVSAVLVFDSTALLREVLIPADVAVNSVIYRLRATDTAFDYPLIFDLKDTTTVAVEALNCTRFNSVCQANLILKKKLEIGRFYDFRLEVRNQRGQTVAMNCSFQATNATTPIERIFPGAPSLLTVSENAGRNTELGTIIAKGNPSRIKAVYMELYGTLQFGIHQKLISDKDAQGTIVLLAPLDYETKTVHHLTILANDPWTNTNEDTRNIAGWPLLLAVIDEQDTPPIFTIAPPTTTLSPSLKEGDVILRVHAEDGDRGEPRPIRYSLDPEEPASALFRIAEETGELTLARPIGQVASHSTQGQPILLKVTAEEVRSNSNEAPSQATTVRLALVPPGTSAAGTPTFGSVEYHALLDENASAGTVLDLPQAEVSTEAGELAALELANNNGTFEVTPSVVEGFARFRISVHDNRLLDYEARRYVECFIVAKALGRGNFSARAKLTVVLNDVNDNPPRFVKSEFKGSVPEHTSIGTTVLVVEATDIDREPGSRIRYMDLTGSGSGLFDLDPETGLITVADSEGLDAETFPKVTLEVKAIDENGQGLSATAAVLITLLDINDNAPQFEKDIYEFILNTDRTTFTTQAFVKAFDKDVSPPNNNVRYQLLDADDRLFLDEKTGELLVKQSWEAEELVRVKVRAYDEGIPRLSSDCEVRVYPPEAKSRKMLFIVPGKYPEKTKVERTLSALTGGRVVVDEIKPYTQFEPGATYVTRDQDGDKCVVVATVHYTKDSIVDVNRIQRILDEQNLQKQQDITNLYNEQRPPVVKEQQETVIKKGSTGSDLLWLLILFIVLAILTAIILILCCICRPCPLYIPPKRRKINSAEAVEKLVVDHHGSSHGKESKSVQVADWFGRKEAWSAEKEPVTVVMVDAETESLRRHEMERGSERGGARRTVRRLQHAQSLQPMINEQAQQQQEMTGREQFYTREGNADILRLVTRAGGDAQQRFVEQQHQQQQQHYLVDSGKDILMRRYIDQQQAEAARVQVLLPNAVNKLQSEHEFLEASLRQQNALLRQLMLDRERDLRLETQSLPAGMNNLKGTQTDQDIGTQTEPQYLRPPRRRVQSDLEFSDDGSDEEIAIIKARAKRRHRVVKPRKIRTPIQEESEVEPIDMTPSYKQRNVEKSKPEIKQTRTSEMRQRTVSDDKSTSRSRSRSRTTRSALRREILREISASLKGDSGGSDASGYSDSLEEITPRSEKTTDSGKNGGRSRSLTYREAKFASRDGVKRNAESRYRSDSDLRVLRGEAQIPAKAKKTIRKSQSQADLKGQGKPAKKPNTKPRTSRYMEWYTKNKSQGESAARDVKKPPDVGAPEAEKAAPKPIDVESRLFKQTVSSSNKKVDSKKASSLGPEHPLLQHSEYRFEAPYSIKKRPEEDADSGIVLAKPEMARKKSVFTIAYNDMHTSQLRTDSSVNTP